uniref:Uncharacterized protein n=1 Tax=Prymnesium polylepis TaxID=72548 RepID=A0A7S4KES3_9EUKA
MPTRTRECPATTLDGLPPLWPEHAEQSDPYRLRAAHAAGSGGQKEALRAWMVLVERARSTIRPLHPVRDWMEWATTSVEGEGVGTLWAELAKKFDGIVYVGDSQVREVAWATMQWVANSTGQRIELSDRAYRHFSPRRRAAAPVSPCTPMEVGKLGFTGHCPTAARHEKFATGSPCELHSNQQPSRNITSAQLFEHLMHPYAWDGVVTLNERACEGFVVSYQAVWGAAQLQPDVLPPCFHRRRLLWVVNGAQVHELLSCSNDRLHLPRRVLARFSPKALRERVVWQPAAGAYFDDWNCSETTADVAAAEVAWLKQNGVRYYNNTKLMSQHAPLMQDAKHWTYYWAPCHLTFPEMTLVSALQAVRAAVLPAGACEQ